MAVAALPILISCAPATPPTPTPAAKPAEPAKPAAAAPAPTAAQPAAPATAAPTPAAPTAAPAATPVGAPATETAAQPQLGQVPRERTLIYGFEGGPMPNPENANPYFSPFISKGLHQSMIESLFYLNIIDGKLTPWLAESVKYNPDFTQATIALRKGVEWSDGKPFTARDVVFTVNMLKDNAPQIAYSADMKQWVKEVTAVDDQTVTLTFTKSNPRFVLEYFSVHFWGAVRIVPEHLWKGQDPVKFTNLDLAKGWPVFTGPYRLVKISQTEVIFDRRDDWWGKKTGFRELPGPVRTIHVDQGPTDRVVAMLTNNEVDTVDSISAGPFQSVAARNKNVVAWSKDKPFGYVDACPFGCVFNTAKAPWSDPDVRWAVNYALDKATYLRLAHEGAMGPDWLARFVFPRYGPLEARVDKNQDIFEKYNPREYSPEKAKQILDQKGYKAGGDGIRVGPDGKRLQATIAWIPTAYVEFAAPVEFLVQNLKAIGIDATQKQLTFAAFGEVVPVGNFDLALLWVCGSVVDPWKTLDNFHTKRVKPVGERSTSDVPTRWTGPKAEAFSKLVDEMAVLAPEDPKLDGLVRQAMELFMAELPVAPLHQQSRVFPYNTTYWQGYPNLENPYIQPPPFWMSHLQVLMNLRPTK
jgi:peptide/nickel transport system substrate-binding protein